MKNPTGVALILVRTVGRHYYALSAQGLMFVLVLLVLVVRPPSYLLSQAFAQQLVYKPVYYWLILAFLNIWTLNFLLFLLVQIQKHPYWQWRMLDLLPLGKRLLVVLPLVVAALAPILSYQTVLLYHFVGMNAPGLMGLTISSVLISTGISCTMALYMLGNPASSASKWQWWALLTDRLQVGVQKLLVNRHYRFWWGNWILNKLPFHLVAVKVLSLLLLSFCLEAMAGGRYRANLLMAGMCVSVALHTQVVRHLFYWTERTQTLFRQLPLPLWRLGASRWLGLAAVLLPEGLLLLVNAPLGTGLSAWALGASLLYAGYMVPFSGVEERKAEPRVWVAFLLTLLALTAGVPGWLAASLAALYGNWLLWRGYYRFSPHQP